MKSDVKNIEDLVAKYNLIPLKQGEKIVIFDPGGNRHIWHSEKSGIYNVDFNSLVKSRWYCTITKIQMGAQYTERGGPPYRERTIKFLWGKETTEKEELIP